MKDILHFEPLTKAKYQRYIEVGTLAYNQHYKHLWPNGNSQPYISSSFTNEVLQKEECDSNTILYLIQWNGEVVGIFKFTMHCKLGTFDKNEALYVDKIYILNEYSGKGIGKKVLQFVAQSQRTRKKNHLARHYAERACAKFLSQKRI